MTKSRNETVINSTIPFMIYITIVLMVTTVITYWVNPDLKSVLDGVASKVPEGLEESEGVSRVMGYIMNNGFTVPFQMFLFALLPIPFLYCIQITMTAVLPGILFGLILRYDLKEAVVIIISSLPHFYIELLGLSVMAALLYRLNNALYRRWYMKLTKRPISFDLKDEVVRLLKYYVLLVLPIIIIAALTETYVAQWLNDLMTRLMNSHF